MLATTSERLFKDSACAVNVQRSRVVVETAPFQSTVDVSDGAYQQVFRGG